MAWDKILIAAAAGGVVLFVWNAVVWMVIQWHNSDFQRVPQAGPVEEGLLKSGMTSGLYMIPHADDFPQKHKDPALAARFQKGPNATMIVSPPGPCMMGSTFGLGFLFYVLEAMGGAILFYFAGGHVEALPRALGFGAGLGLLVRGIPNASLAIWMKFPWPYVVKNAVDGAVGMALACLVFHFVL